MANTDSTHEADIKEVFSLFDVDKTDAISIDVLETAMLCLGRRPSDSDITEVNDGNGNVTQAKFHALMKRKLNEEEDDEDIFNAFKVFDKDGYGVLKATDIRQAMTNLGGGLTSKEANDILEDAVGSSEDVDYKDLIKVMASG